MSSLRLNYALYRGTMPLSTRTSLSLRMNKSSLPLPRNCGAAHNIVVTPHSADAHMTNLGAGATEKYPHSTIIASKRFSQGADQNPEEKGSEIVRVLVMKLESVFPTPSFTPGSTFLRLIACVETKDSSTYPKWVRWWNMARTKGSIRDY